MKIARSLPPRPREDSSVLARARDARGSGALSAPHRAPLHSLRAEQSRGYGEEEEPRSKGEPRRHKPSCAIRTALGPGRWGQGDENSGVILLRSDMHRDGLCRCPPNQRRLLILCLFSDGLVPPGSSILLARTRQEATGVPTAIVADPR